MKRPALIIISIFILFLSGCGKAQLDEDGCFVNVEAALKNASRKKHDVLLFITMEGYDTESTSLIENVIRNDLFKSQIAGNYSVAHIDFSQEDTHFASLLNVSQTPVVFILSKESYVLSSFVYEPEGKNLSDFTKLLEEKSAAADGLRSLIADTKKGSSLEKISAIDRLYEATESDYRVFLSDLITSVIKLDKDNESGLLGKYIYASADANAIKAINRGESKAAVAYYVQAAENPLLEANLKQQAYYIAAYLCSITGTEDTTVISGYLQKSIDAAPESPEAPSIKRVLDVISEVKSAESELK